MDFIVLFFLDGTKKMLGTMIGKYKRSEGNREKKKTKKEEEFGKPRG